MKNLAMLAGRPLIDYGIAAAKASSRLERILCSTDSEAIASRAEALGVEVVRRPAHLATDEARVDDVARDLLASLNPGTKPDAIVLVQPTSPFLLPEHISELVALLDRCPAAASVHNVVRVTHKCHAWNQRTVGADGRAGFLFAAEREAARHKQEKPALWAFGNLIGARTDALERGGSFYAEPAHTVPIEPPYDLDVDAPYDLQSAEALLAAGLVRLDHLARAASRKD